MLVTWPFIIYDQKKCNNYKGLDNLAKWEPDRFIDEVYDEHCRKCNCMTEHSMGICLPCEIRKPAQVKNRNTGTVKTKREGES